MPLGHLSCDPLESSLYYPKVVYLSRVHSFASHKSTLNQYFKTSYASSVLMIIPGKSTTYLSLLTMYPQIMCPCMCPLFPLYHQFNCYKIHWTGKTFLYLELSSKPSRINRILDPMYCSNNDSVLITHLCITVQLVEYNSLVHLLVATILVKRLSQ